MKYLLFLGAMLTALTSTGQFIVRGVVYDNEGIQMPGVNVVEEGYGKTSTDADGKFTLKCSAKNPVLIFSFIGFLDEVIHVDSTHEVSVKMRPDSVVLTEHFICCFAYDRYSNIGLSSGLLLTPFGLKVENFTSYLFGINPLLVSELEWRTNNSTNNYFDISLERLEIARIARKQLGVFAEYNGLSINSTRIREVNFAPSLSFGRVRIFAGWTYQMKREFETETSGSGVYMGANIYPWKQLGLDLRSKYVLERFQHDMRVTWNIRNIITLGLGYQRIGDKDEMISSLQYKISY